MAPKESTQFTKANNPARAGLEPNEKEVSWKEIRPISFRPFAEDIERLRAMKIALERLEDRQRGMTD